MEKNIQKVTDLKTYKKALDSERKILEKQYNLDSELRIFDVEVTLNGIETFIHSYVCGEANTQTLVLLHGFGGSGITYYKMIKSLATKFRVFTLDFIGMGLSDRQNFSIPENPTSVINFFVESIEQWRKTLGIKQFKLAGHSFGGYIAANYTVKYQNNVDEVFLLSPMAGTQVLPENDLSNEENFKTYVNKLPLMRRLAMKFVKCQTTNQKITPGILLKKWFVPQNFILGKVVEKRLKINDKDEKTLWKKFLKNTFKLPQSTEQCIHDLIGFPGAQAKLSIEQIVNIIFGDDDWMNTAGCKRLLDQGYLQGELITVTKAGHQLPFDQPEAIASIILKSLYKTPFNDSYTPTLYN